MHEPMNVKMGGGGKKFHLYSKPQPVNAFQGSNHYVWSNESQNRMYMYIPWMEVEEVFLKLK
jgi:hypothetical protein